MKSHHRSLVWRAGLPSVLASLLWVAPALSQQAAPPPADPDEVVNKEKGEDYAIEQREEWFYRQRQAGTKGDMAELRERAVTFTMAQEAMLGRSPEGMGIWTSRGPASSRFGGWAFGRVSGRVVSLAKDWANNILYAGSASGGVWKTVNDGASWTPVFESAGTMTVGAITLDPGNSATLWVGTGENTKYFCEDYFGIGLLRSPDRGATWELRNGSGANTLENLSVFAGVSVDPRSSNSLVVGGRTRDCQTGTYGPGGIYSTTDGGATWTKRLTGYVTAIARSSDPDVLWAGAYFSTATPLVLGGVYKSTDNGVTWILQTASSLPSGNNAQRVEIAVAPSDVNTVYALYANVISAGQAQLWKTTNGGTSWTQMATGATACDGQCQYNLALKVHPTTPTTLYRGTVQFFRSTNSGTSWTNLTGSWGSSQKVHQDTHAVLINPTNASEIYVGSDGGVWKTVNGGSSFTNLNSNLNLTQFYDIGIHPTSDEIICGGAQDNSSLARQTENVWDVQTVTGDGFVCAINTANPNINYITSYPSGSLPSVYRATSGILGSYNVITGSGSGIGATSRIEWVTPYTLSWTNPSTLFLGTYQMYRTTNGGTSWSPVGPADMSGGGSERISTVSVSRTNGSYVYGGTTDGRVWRSTDGGTSWSQLAGGLPVRRINDVESDPVDPTRAFCVVSGFNTAHLFEYKSEWIARGDGLPNVPANTVLAVSPNDIFVGTDVGIFVSRDGGKNFLPFNSGLPAGLVVMDLEYNASTGTVTAGTYGRGAWQHTLCRALDQCHDIGVNDPGTGECTNPAKPDGSACDDGLACTTSDTCQAGTCASGPPVICTPLDSCHTAGTCQPISGVCSNPTQPNGASCDDGNACTQSDACSTGACVGSNPVTCSASDACHVAGTCNPESGSCSNPAAPNGTSCDDSDACTHSDSCQSGVCTGSNPVVCSPMDSCHLAGVCDSQSGSCSNPLAADGTTCSDGNACTQSDACDSGECRGSNPVTCVAGDSCHVAGICDPQTGACSNPNAPDGTACDDANACTPSSSCSGGSCLGANPVVCAGGDQCHGAGMCDTQTGACGNPVPLDGTACEDGDPCTADDACAAGVCTSGAPVSAPPEVEGVAFAADKTTLTWSAAPTATQYEVVRGVLALLPVGTSSGDESCFTGLNDPSFVDATEPEPDAAFWYLSRGGNACAGAGTFGTQSDGSPRVTTACP